MNKPSRKHKQAVSLFLLISLNVSLAAAQIRVAADLPDFVRTQVDPLVSSFQKELAGEGFNLELPASIEIRALAPGTGVWARSRKNWIELNPKIKRAEFASVFRHELAHLAFENHCAQLSERAPLLSETFALWASHDYKRISLSQKEFVFAKQAQDWLSSQIGSRNFPRKKTEEALARLLAQEQDHADLKKFYLGQLQNCAKADGLRSENELAQIFSVQGKSQTPIDFLLLDSASGEALESSGQVEKYFPVGSILKPALLAADPTFLRSRSSRAAAEWNCPDLATAETIRPWTWQEALVKSCNGFFLDAAENSDLHVALALLARFKIEKAKSIQEIIGLIPSTRTSLSKIASLYRYLVFTQPAIIDALKETPRIGTVSTDTDAKWFVQNKIALKTGTLRSVDAKPLEGWIVAIAWPTPDSKPLIAVIHGEGRAPIGLLVPLQQKLAPYIGTPNREAEVQVLGLVPASKLQLSCDGDWLIKKLSGQWHFERGSFEKTVLLEHSEPGTRFFCARGPVQAHFPKSNGEQTTRSYNGVFEFSPLTEPQEQTQATAKQKRARAGSALILHTSETAYTTSVIASEFPNARPEVQKALAFIVRNNLHYHRHGDRPVCDTTHCQVFGVETGVTQAVKQKIVTTVRLSEKTPPSPLIIGAQWMPFYLGGTKPWQGTVDNYQIQSAFSTSPAQIAFVSGNAEFKSSDGTLVSKISCEEFRNRLRLLSCPQTGSLKNKTWTFKGRGEGHGLGLPLIEADIMARQGSTARDILQKYFSKPVSSE